MISLFEYCKTCGGTLQPDREDCPNCGAKKTEQTTDLNQEVAQTEPAADAANAPESTEENQDAPDEAEVTPVEAVQNDTAETVDAVQEPAAPQKSRKTVPIVVASLALAVLLGLYLGGLLPGIESPLFAGGAGAPAEDPDVPQGTVVAEIDDYQLDDIALDYYYWGEYFFLYNTYSGYLDTIIDPNLPLSQQEGPGEQSWRDYLVGAAVTTWIQAEMLGELAQQDNFVLPDENQQVLDGLYADLESFSAENGYESIDAYLQATFGEKATFDSYIAYLEESYMASAYANHRYSEIYQSLEGQHADRSIYNKNVRHLLIQPENTEDPASWAAAKIIAEDLYAEWQQNPTEDNFAAMATAHSQDPGSVEVGGLYEEVYPSQMVSEFDAWIFDAANVAAGSTGIVQTEFGFHILYQVGDGGLYMDGATVVAEEQYNEWLNEVFATGVPEIYYDRITIE